MNTRRLVTWITFLAVFAIASRVSMDSDTWWHLRAGKWIIQNHGVLHFDPFSYTKAGEPWEYPGWLVEAPMYIMYQLLGPGGLNLWTALMVVITFVFVWQTLSGGVFLKGFVIILAATVSGVYWAARPYLITFLFSAIFLCILEENRWGSCTRSTDRTLEQVSDLNLPASRWLWWLPALMVVWVNSHGGFAVGFILLGIYTLDQLVQEIPGFSKFDFRKSKFIHLLLIGLVTILVVCVNPYGVKMLAYPFKTVSIGALQEFIQEWQSPNFHLRSAQPFIWLWILTFGAVGISRKRLAFSDFLLVACFSYLSLLAWRNVALFAIVSPAMLTRHAAPVMTALGRRIRNRLPTSPPPSRRLELLNWILLVVLALAVAIKAGVGFPQSANQSVFRETLPVDAVTFIKSKLFPGRLFNSYNWGGYLLWELPEYPVFIDGRTDLYDGEIIDQWLQVARAEEGWQRVLDQWEVHLVLLEPSMPVVSSLKQNGWKLLYQDEKSVIYAR
jgi:hypothetical protein